MSQLDEITVKFGLQLAKLRTEAGMSQQKLAEEIGVDRTYISLLERGLRNPTLKKLWLISQVLGKELSVLVKF